MSRSRLIRKSSQEQYELGLPLSAARHLPLASPAIILSTPPASQHLFPLSPDPADLSGDARLS